MVELGFIHGHQTDNKILLHQNDKVPNYLKDSLTIPLMGCIEKIKNPFHRQCQYVKDFMDYGYEFLGKSILFKMFLIEM